MTTAQVVKTSVTVNNIQDYVNLDDQTQSINFTVILVKRIHWDQHTLNLINAMRG